MLDVGGYYKNVITFAPSLDISDEEIDLALALLDQLIVRVTGDDRTDHRGRITQGG